MKVKISEYYLPLLKNVSSDIKLISHQYSVRAGLIKQCSSGIYTWLPLGLRVLQKIQNIVRQELSKAGFIEILMPCIQSADIWKESGRYNSYGNEMLKIKDRHKNEVLFGPTNEELITNVIKGDIKSYKDLPKIFWQMQWKFRDEIRPRFGLMRAREFLMKDGYGFFEDQDCAKQYYDKMYQIYLNIFKKLGVDVVPCRADAGAIGGHVNHEFHVVTKNNAEGKIFYDTKLPELIKEFHNTDQANADAILKLVNKMQTTYSATEEKEQAPNNQSDIQTANGIEVGHIFSFGDKYSGCANAVFVDKKGNKKPFYMGSYGIGISRLVAAIIEANHDKRGIVWPKNVSPFSVGLINLDNNACGIASKIFENLDDIIYDDTDQSSGTKFACMDLLGIPTQIIVGKNTLKNNTVEIKYRATDKCFVVSVSKIEEFLNTQCNKQIKA
jgi:prolyl-tRNA synthetase